MEAATLGNRHPVVDFDHHFQDGALPEDGYGQLRSKCPVAWTERHGGYWVVTSHKEVGRVLKDYESFSSARNEVTGDNCAMSVPVSRFGFQVPEELDPPEFFPYKRLLQGVLSPKAVSAGLAGRVRHWIDVHIDEFIERGECDLVYDLTSPVPGAVTLEWLGFPQDDWRRISEAVHDTCGLPPQSDGWERAVADLRWLDIRIAEEVAVRQEELATGRTRGDVIGYVVAQEIDGQPMAAEMAEAIIRVVALGGVDTTTSSTTSALVHLHQHPDQRQQLIEHPELWDTAIEEFIRRYPPVLSHARTVAKEVEVAGCVMRPGERIVASEASACWDEDEFERADEVILDRFPNRHVAFGLGIHRCPGMHLARLEMRCMLEQVLERMPDYQIDDTSLQRYPVQASIAGWTRAAATFTPGRRRVP
jgi:cytochrome P450